MALSGRRRLFVAVWPDEATRHLLHGLETELGPVGGLRFVDPSLWHVTLRFLGPVGREGAGGTCGQDELVARLVHALEACCSTFPGPLECHLGPSTAWFSSAPVLHLPATGLDGLAGVVCRATSPVVPQPAGEQAFYGHLTLARPKGQRVSVAAMAQRAGIPFDAAFPADHVDLVASDPSPQGHRYTTLARVPLGSAHGGGSGTR